MLWITRTADKAAAYVEAAERAGLSSFCSPLLRISYQTDGFDLHEAEGLIVTSANALYALGDGAPHALPLFTVGDQTASIAKSLGFTDVRSADGTVSDLMGLLGAQAHTLSGKRLVYLSGRDITQEIIVQGLSIERQVVYRADHVDALPVDVVNALLESDCEGILFFSERATQAFQSLIAEHNQSADLQESLTRTKALCLSDKMLKSLSSLRFEDVRAAETPDQKGMTNLIEVLSPVLV